MLKTAWFSISGVLSSGFSRFWASAGRLRALQGGTAAPAPPGSPATRENVNTERRKESRTHEARRVLILKPNTSRFVFALQS